MKAQMTRELFNVIYALHLHKRLLVVDGDIRNQHCYQNWYEKNHDYFKSLPLPEGMTHCEACYKAMFNYPIEKCMNLEDKELSHLTFGY